MDKFIDCKRFAWGFFGHSSDILFCVCCRKRSLWEITMRFALVWPRYLLQSPALHAQHDPAASSHSHITTSCSNFSVRCSHLLDSLNHVYICIQRTLQELNPKTETPIAEDCGDLVEQCKAIQQCHVFFFGRAYTLCKH